MSINAKIITSCDKRQSALAAYFNKTMYVINEDTLKTVTEIPVEAFKGRVLTDIKIPPSITKIGDRAFYNCKGFRTLTIPASVNAWGDYVFWDCNMLESVEFESGVTEVPTYMFRECCTLSNIIMPNTITSIKSGGFGNCKNLKSVTLPSSLLVIGDYAFWYANLSEIIIPDSVTSIGSHAFAYCPNLTTVTIGSGVRTIGSNVFRDTLKLTKIIYNGTTSQWNSISLPTTMVYGSAVNAVTCTNGTVSIT